MSSQHNRSDDFMEGESKNKSNSVFGKCLDCGKDRSSERWCKDCAFKENSTSSNINIDDFIKHTQLNATGIEEYIEYIDFQQFGLKVLYVFGMKMLNNGHVMDL